MTLELNSNVVGAFPAGVPVSNSSVIYNINVSYVPHSEPGTGVCVCVCVCVCVHSLSLSDSKSAQKVKYNYPVFLNERHYRCLCSMML